MRMNGSTLIGTVGLGVALAVCAPPAQAQVDRKPGPVAMKLPDLVVTSVKFDFVRHFKAPDGSTCTDFQLRPTFRNRGAAPTGKTAYYAIYRGRSSGGRDEMAGSYAVPELAVDESVETFAVGFCTCHFDIENNVSRPYTNAFRVVVDYHRDITESNEGNNSRSGTFRVPMTRR